MKLEQSSSTQTFSLKSWSFSMIHIAIGVVLVGSTVQCKVKYGCPGDTYHYKAKQPSKKASKGLFDKKTTKKMG
jgi:hypothetical protein